MDFRKKIFRILRFIQQLSETSKQLPSAPKQKLFQAEILRRIIKKKKPIRPIH